MIAACLPNPKKYTVKPLSNYVKYRSAAILRQMNNLAGDPDIAAHKWPSGPPAVVSVAGRAERRLAGSTRGPQCTVRTSPDDD